MHTFISNMSIDYFLCMHYTLSVTKEILYLIMSLEYVLHPPLYNILWMNELLYFDYILSYRIKRTQCWLLSFSLKFWFFGNRNTFCLLFDLLHFGNTTQSIIDEQVLFYFYVCYIHCNICLLSVTYTYTRICNVISIL